MLRDALLIAPSRKQPPSIAASLPRHVLELTPALGEKRTLLGPSPVVPDAAMGLVLVCVMLGLTGSLSQALCFTENQADACSEFPP